MRGSEHSLRAGVNLSKVFDQYLRSTMVPTFEYKIDGDTLRYRWSNVVKGFDMPLAVTLDWPSMVTIHPTEAWQSAHVKLPNASDFRVDQNYYVTPKRVDQPAP